MKLIFHIFFLTQALFTFGQYELDIIDDLEPELIEKWTIDYIQDNNIKSVSARIKAENYKIIKRRRSITLLKYDPQNNTINYKPVSVWPTLDKGGYLILHSRNITLHFDEDNLLIEKTEQSVDTVYTDNYWQTEMTSKTLYKYKDKRVIQESILNSEIKSTKTITINGKLDSSYVIIKSKTIYDYEYYPDSNVVYRSYLPDKMIYGSRASEKKHRGSQSMKSGDKNIIKKQFINHDSLVTMELNYRFGDVDTVIYNYHDRTLISKEYITNMRTTITYNNDGRILSRCMSTDDEHCSYFNYDRFGDKEFRQNKKSWGIYSSEITYNSSGLIIEKLVRCNGKKIIKYQYEYD